MWRSKKFILAVVLAVVVLLGSTAGVVLAQAGNGDDSHPWARQGDLFDRVCEIYNANTDPDIDCEALKAAFAEAQSEMRQAAMQDRLQKMVEEGIIEPEQATEIQEWWEARPDVPMKFGFGGRGGFRGFGGPCPAP